MWPGTSLPGLSTFVYLLKDFSYCQKSQRQRSFNWQETVFTLSGFPIIWCAAFSRNTIASKNRNCLDLPSSQHNDSRANGTGLELGPNTLKPRDSTKERKATSSDFQERAGSCLLIPHSFVILFDFANKTWVGGRKERKRGHGPKGRNEGEGAKEDQVGVVSMGYRR